MSRPQVFKRLVTLAVLASLCSALFVSSSAKVHAANPAPATVNTSSKISPDLRQLILSGQGDKRVKVIVQQVQESGGLLSGLLNTVGGLLEGVLSKVTASDSREPRVDEGRSQRTGPTLPLLLTSRRIDAGESQ